MKRIDFIPLLAAIAFIVSCEVSEPIRPYNEDDDMPAYGGDLYGTEWETLVFTSEAGEEAEDSKTIYSGGTILWSQGDKIRMGYTVAGQWQGARGNATQNSPAKLYESDELSSGGASAEFTIPTQFTGTVSGEYKFYTIYPSSAAAENFSSAPSTTIDIPTEQTPPAGSFDPAADLMVGHSVGTYTSKPTGAIPLVWERKVAHGEITLKNFSSITGFSPSETIQSVTLTAQDNAALTGSYSLNLLTGDISASSASNSVTVAGDNLSWDNGNLTFWIGILPVSISSLTVSVETDKAIYTRTFPNIANPRQFICNAHNRLPINMAGATRTEYYKKVTSAQSDWSGEYLIVYEDGNLAFNGGLQSNLHAKNNTISVEISNNRILASSATRAAQFTITSSSENLYTIKSQSGYYIGNTQNTTYLNYDTETQYPNQISYNNSSISIKSSGGALLRYNTSIGSTTPRFVYVASGSASNCPVIQLYKLTSSGGTTLDPATATVTTSAASDIAQTTATLNGSYTGATGEISEVGFYWGTSSTPSTPITGTDTNGSISANLTGLTANTTYYFQAYVKEYNASSSSVEERKGEVLSFTTEAEPQTVTQYVKVTSEPSNWNGTYLLVYEETSTSGRVCTAGVDAASNYVTATISSSVILADNLSDYEVEIATYSTGYSIKALGGTNANKYLEGQGSSSNGTSFAASPSLVTTLVLSDGVVTITNNSNVFAYNSAANNYRWRFFKSTTASGNGYYKPALYLKSGSATPQVTVTTSAASNITSTSAKLNGSYVVPTGLSVTERGFFYGTTNNPSGKITVSGTGTSFSTTLTGLSEGTTYFFKAYAIESNGTYRYGEVMSFTASTPSALPKHLGCYEIPAIGTVSNAAEGYEVLPSEQDATDNNPRTKWLRWDTGNSNQKIVTHTFWNSHVSPNKTMRSYTLLQDFDKKCALWVACSMNNDVYPQKVSRSEKWCYDPALPNSWQPNLTSSYPNKNGLSYDRGHQLAASYRETTTNQVKMTCYFTNMTPQLSSLNQGVWQSTVEANIRSLGAATSGRDTLYVVSGPLFIGSYDTVEDKDGLSCAKPTHYFQCFMKVSFNSSGVPQSAKGAAYLVEHTASPNVQYKTIDYIESLAGFDFFANVPSAIQNAAESTATPYDQF